MDLLIRICLEETFEREPRMFVLHCMKAGCMVIAILSAIDYLAVLVEMVPGLFSPKSFLRDIDGWSSQAQRPLFVGLLGNIGFCLCCLAKRFSLRKLPTTFEQDYGDQARIELRDDGGSAVADRQGQFTLFMIRLMKQTSMVVAVLGFMGFALAVLAFVSDPRRRYFIDFDAGGICSYEHNWRQTLTPSLTVMALSAVSFSMCCLAERFLVKPTDVVDHAPTPSQPASVAIQ